MKGCRPVTNEEFSRIMNAFTGRYSIRNRAIFAFGCSTGYRISEILSLRRSDIINADGIMFDNVTVKRKFMKGKYKSRTVRLNATAKQYLLKWLQTQESMGYMRLDKPLFCRNGGERLDRKAVWRILKDTYRAAGLSGQGLATHTMRKTFADRIHNQFSDKDALRNTCKILGHSRIDTTEQYLSFQDELLDKAIMEVSFEDIN